MLRYLDSGIDGPDACLGRWLDEAIAAGICAFRGQFGFYDGAALRGSLPALFTMAAAGGTFRLVVGANGIEPASVDDLQELLPILVGRPSTTSLTVIALSNALFHPKTLHLVSSADVARGVVGSANLTAKGLGHNVEASLIVEASAATNALLAEMARAIDFWSTSTNTGVYQVRTGADVDRLAALGLAISTRAKRRLRSAGRGRASTHGRGTRAAGWRPPGAAAREQEPPELEVAEDATQVQPDNAPPDDAAGPVVVRGPVAARWCKRLKGSDAQQVAPDTNPTGKLRLAKAGFNIDQATYFRDEFFGDAAWIEVSRNGKTYEEVNVPFHVLRPDAASTVIILRVDHAEHREADQNNVCTVLGWGTELGVWLRANSQVDNWVVLERDVDGRYWMSFTDTKPSWAP